MCTYILPNVSNNVKKKTQVIKVKSHFIWSPVTCNFQDRVRELRNRPTSLNAMWIKQYLFSSESHQIFVSSMGCFKRDSTSSDSHPTMIHFIVKLCLCLIETLLATEEKDLSTSSTTYDFCVVQDRCIYFIRKNIATENTAYKCTFFWKFWLRWTGSFSHLETSALHFSPNEDNRKGETMTYALSDTTGCCVLIKLL